MVLISSASYLYLQVETYALHLSLVRMPATDPDCSFIRTDVSVSSSAANLLATFLSID